VRVRRRKSRQRWAWILGSAPSSTAALSRRRAVPLASHNQPLSATRTAAAYAHRLHLPLYLRAPLLPHITSLASAAAAADNRRRVRNHGAQSAQTSYARTITWIAHHRAACMRLCLASLWVHMAAVSLQRHWPPLIRMVLLAGWKVLLTVCARHVDDGVHERHR